MPQLLILKVGQVADISWTLSETVDLIISQRNSPSDQIDRPPNSENINANTYKWKVNVDGTDGGAKFDLKFSNQFNFLLFKHGETSFLASSSWFNVSDETIDEHGIKISTTSSLTTSTSSSTSSSSTSAATTGTTTTTSQITTPTGLAAEAAAGINKPVNPNTTSSGLSTGVKAAIGVVVAVAVIAIIALILFCRRRENKNNAAQPDESSSPAYQENVYQENVQMSQGPSELASSPGAQLQTKVPHPAEVSGTSRPSELHGSTGTHGEYGTRLSELP